MGNSIHVSLRNYAGSAQFPSDLQLGRSGTIHLRTARVDSLDFWNILYILDGSTCNLSFIRAYDEFGKVFAVVFTLCEDKYLNCDRVNFNMKRTQTGFLEIQYNQIHGERYEAMKWTKTNRKVGARGGFTDTKVHLYGDANGAGLLVSECKSNSWNHEEISEVTLTHYFANGSGSAFMGTESDIGLSVVSKFRMSNGNLDVTVEGLEQHPAFALFYMFHEVNRSGVWKRTMCPHCYDKRRGRMFWQSDSDDSDGNVLIPSRHGSEHIRKSIFNEGRFKGNGNGNFIQYAKMFFAS